MYICISVDMYMYIYNYIYICIYVVAWSSGVDSESGGESCLCLLRIFHET